MWIDKDGLGGILLSPLSKKSNIALRYFTPDDFLVTPNMKVAKHHFFHVCFYAISFPNT